MWSNGRIHTQAPSWAIFVIWENKGSFPKLVKNQVLYLSFDDAHFINSNNIAFSICASNISYFVLAFSLV